jgi:glycosyltransferase involved in cell wall biosynthesis
MMDNLSITLPLVSICIPAYNSRPFIERSVNSALSQNYPNYEVVICDDNTTDGTWDFLKKIKNPKVRVFRNSVNLGNHGNHNQTVSYAKGKFIKFLHDDDEMLDDTLSYMIEWLLLYPNVVATVVPCIFIDENSKVVGQSPSVNNPLLVTGRETLQKMPLYGNQIGCTGNILLRKDSYLTVGGMDEKMIYSGDLDLFSRLSTIGDWIHLPDHGYRYRLGNVTSLTYSIYNNYNNNIIAFNELIEIAEKTGSNNRLIKLTLKDINKWKIRICSEWIQGGVSVFLRSNNTGLLKFIIKYVSKNGLITKVLWQSINHTILHSLKYWYFKKTTGCGFKQNEMKNLEGKQIRN